MIIQETIIDDEITTLYDKNGVEIIDNVEDNRLQIFFPGKPDADVRKDLKSHGFKWSPSTGSWQRFRSRDANYYALNIVKKHYDDGSIEESLIREDTNVALNLSKTLDKIKIARSFDDQLSAILNWKKSKNKTPKITRSSDYRKEDTEFGLKVKGKKAREELNTKVKEIVEKVDSLDDLNEEQVDLIMQYSGKGGLEDNSLFEYYTPTFIAEGMWDLMKANGFENGNTAEPSTGAGVFSATKPKGTIITGAEIDPTSSKVNQLLHPEDAIHNKSFEEMNMETPDNTFDSVIGNVPFAPSRGKYQWMDPEYKNEKKIELYFIHRSIDKVKPGRLVVLVCPTGILTNKGKYVDFRMAVSKKAEFLGAHKLPSKTFKNQGTDVVTDILVFKKHPQDLLDKVEDLPENTLYDTRVYYKEFIKGQYWKDEGKKYVHGKYTPKLEGERFSREIVDGDIDNESLKKKLAIRFKSRIDWDELNTAELVQKNYIDGDRKYINGKEYEMMAGSWVLVNQEPDEIVKLDKDKFGAANLAELKGLLSSIEGALTLPFSEAYEAYLAFPDIFSPLMKEAIETAMAEGNKYGPELWKGCLLGGMVGRLQFKQQDGDENAELYRKAVQDAITNHLKDANLPSNNKALLKEGSKSKAFGLFTGALKADGSFSDMLKGDLERNQGGLQYDPTNIEAIVEHLYERIGVRDIELDNIQNLYTGTKDLNSLDDIAPERNVAITSDGMIEPMGRFIVGDIYPKIDSLNDAIGSETNVTIKNKYQEEINLMLKSRKSTELEDMSFTLQQKWIPKKYILEFFQISGLKELNLKYGVMEDEEYEDPYTDETKTRTIFKQDLDAVFGEWKLGAMGSDGFNKQFVKYLNGKKVGGQKKKDKDGEVLRDNKKEYNDKVRTYNEQFQAFMEGHPSGMEVQEIYNRKFNSFSNFEYSEEPLDLDSYISGAIQLHGYQAAAVRRLSEEGRGILAFDVGLGKSYTALGLHAQNMKMGRSKRTCIVVPNSVLANWYHESNLYMKDLSRATFIGFEPKINKKTGKIEEEEILDQDGNPTGNFQHVLKKDSPEDKARKAHSIPQSNYNLVVMTKDFYRTIPLKPETKEKFISKQMQKGRMSDQAAGNVMMGDARKKGDKRSYDEIKSDTIRENKLSKDLNRKDALPYFEDMAFDSVIVDECFPYDTIIITKYGPMRIGTIVENEFKTDVLSYNKQTGKLEWKPIVRWLPKKLKKSLVKVVHSTGSFVCTDNHKIWTKEEGYVRAKNLHSGHSLQTMQETVRDTKSWETNSEVLQQEVCLRLSEDGTTYVPDMQETYERRETRQKNEEVLFNGMQEQSFVFEINSRKNDSNRSRWEYSQAEEMEIPGQKENRSFECSRMVGVEILERRDYERFGCGDGENSTVYDIEVEDNHNYIADGVLVSNCHEFKNSFEPKEMQGIAYLNSAPSSQRAMDLAVKMDHIKDANNGRGPVALTATPVTNSPFEIFNMLSHVCPDEAFEKFNVHTVDDFISVFGMFNNVKKLKLSGETADQEGLVGFKNLHGLRNLFQKFTNIKIASECADFKLPPYDEINEVVELNNEQTEIYSALKDEAKEAMKPKSKGRHIFAILRDMDKVTTDLELLTKTMTFIYPLAHKSGVDKFLDKLPNKIFVTEEEWDSDKEKMVRVKTPVLLENVLEKNVQGNSYAVTVPISYEKDMMVGHVKAGIKEDEVNHPMMPKYAKLCDNLKKDHQKKGKQIIFTDEKSQHNKISRIIKHNVPIDNIEVAIINADTASGDKLQTISDEYNKGNIKIIIGNKKAEVGVNLQKGTTAIHHLTFPWTPASIQQRNGRALRQGNWASHINIYYYMGKGSIDNYRIDLLKKKASWINDLLTGDNAEALNGDADSFGDAEIMMSDNPEEAKRKLAIQKAEELAKEEAKVKKVMINNLRQMGHLTNDIENHDEIKENEKLDLESKLRVLKEKRQSTLINIGRLKESGGQKTKIKSAKQRLSTFDYKISAVERSMETLDDKHERTKKEKEARLAMLKATLKKKSDKLPFDQAALDNPRNVIVTKNGKAFQKDKLYETHREGEESKVVKITDVDITYNLFEFYVIVGRHLSLPRTSVEGRWGWNNIEHFESMYSPTEASFTEEELELKKILAETVDYSEVHKKLSKEVFTQHAKELSFSYGNAYYRGSAGDLNFTEGWNVLSDDDKAKAVYPEPESENFKSEIFKHWIEAKKTKINPFWIEKILQKLFGYSWKDEALSEFGTKLTKMQIRQAVNRVWDERKNTIIGSLRDGFSVWDGLNKSMREYIESQGDTAKDDFMPIIQSFIESKKEWWAEKEKALENEKEKKRLEELKNHPDYKEIPANIFKAFDNIGITIKVNTVNVQRYSPFSRWMLQDQDSGGGLLRTEPVRRQIKNYWDGAYMLNKGAYKGSWWSVSSSNTLESIYEFLSEQERPSRTIRTDVTYEEKDIAKSHGGQWDGNNWMVPENQIEALEGALGRSIRRGSW